MENLQFSGGFEPALPPPGADSDDRDHNGSGDGDGLDLDHVLPVVEWLARFHGLSLVLLSRSEGGARRWLEENPWVRRMGLSEEREEEENGNTADKGKTGLEKPTPSRLRQCSFAMQTSRSYCNQVFPELLT